LTYCLVLKFALGNGHFWSRCLISLFSSVFYWIDRHCCTGCYPNSCSDVCMPWMNVKRL